LYGRAEPRRGKKSFKSSDERRASSAKGNGEALGELARMWVGGQEIEWDDLYAADRPVKLSLPTYPFEMERHWVTDSRVPAGRAAARQQDVQLHPLVTQNVSTLREICFSSSLSDERYYARDHKVSGEALFPGSGFLEIACASGAIAGEQTVSRISDIVWIQPLKFSTGSQLVRTFLRSNGDSTDYVIVSFDAENERVAHSEGRLTYGPGATHGEPEAAAVSIQALRERCTRSMSGEVCYQQFEQFGFQYGDSFRTIQELHIASHFALSRLELAETSKDDSEQYILHPCLIDGALQTVIGLIAQGEPDTPYLPFALDEVEILHPLPQICYACAEPVTSAHPVQADIKQFNIQLLSESGDVLVRLKNFYVRALRNAPAIRQAADSLLTPA
jgi:acyl transferase domain-containing protein